MIADRLDHPAEDPHADLERAFIAEYLKSRGHTPATLRELPEPEVQSLLREASRFASGRLSEVEARAHYIHDLHDVAPPLPRGSHGDGS